jgi:hypothetical protein
MPAPTPPSDVASNSPATSAWANAVSDALQQLIADLYPAGALGMTWANVTGKPTTFAPTVHAHTDAASGGTVGYGDLTGKPAAFAPSAHGLDPASGPHTGTLPYASVSGKPAAFAPADHALDPASGPHTGTLPWSTVASKPTTFAPTVHAHDANATGGTIAYADLTGTPGVGWLRSGTAIGTRIYGGTVAPASPAEGDIWIKG